ncbi:MAG TPA: hypothetical protein VGH04_14535 [Gemmatimonadaceae bacterium]
MQAGASNVIDPTRPKAELRQAVLECYCALGPACILWRQMTPEQRAACSADRRLTVQRMWKNGM